MPDRPKTHAQLMQAKRPETKPRTASARGYDRQWRKARARFLARNPLCLYCKRQGRDAMATLVDHNPPHQGNQERFWDVRTWTPCCDGCHGYITPAFDGGGGNAMRMREGAYVAPAADEVVS